MSTLGALNAQTDGNNYVAAATPEAIEVGDFILHQGGNAVDAAVAVALTLGVTEPAMSGLGGRTMLILSFPNQEPIAIGGHSITPQFVDTLATRANISYYQQISIPSQLKVLSYTWQKYKSGNLSWEEIVQPAIDYAEKGFVLGLHRHQVFVKNAKQLQESPHHNRELMIDDNIPFVGDLIRQKSLANTLSRIAKFGAEDFYSGEIARKMADDIKEHGGWITYKDLSNFPDPIEYAALHTTYRSYDVYSFPPPGGGWQVLQALNLLEQFDPSIIAENNRQRTKKIIEILNICHNDRLANPINDYYNYSNEVKQKVSKKYAVELLLQEDELMKSKKNGKIDSNKGSGETTHFSIVDDSGLAVSVTSSIGAYFGSKTSTKELGFFYNSYVKSLLGFGLGKQLKGHTIIPSSMSPSLVRKDGATVLVIGTPGSKRIVSTIAQLIQLWVDGQESIHELINLPRIHAISNRVYLEDTSVKFDFLSTLRKEGYSIASPSYSLTKSGLNAYFGGVHAIEWRDGKWISASDPRRDGGVK